MNEFSEFVFSADDSVDFAEFYTSDSDCMDEISNDFSNNDSLDSFDPLLSETSSSNEESLIIELISSVQHLDNTVGLFLLSFLCVFLIKFIGRMFNN